jgi:hypothetical protein
VHEHLQEDVGVTGQVLARLLEDACRRD